MCHKNQNPEPGIDRYVVDGKKKIFVQVSIVFIVLYDTTDFTEISAFTLLPVALKTDGFYIAFNP
jgi:hypothetical protein